ncbi:MAG: carboxypeptidase regulatory-like domain-containing protein [Nitrososphaerota archaeon]|nr:carboxypeptidase regulatory-like domain-containing protein [Nitrososphaerota archaeon]
MVINLNDCVGCGNCVIACKNEMAGNDWSPISAPEPETGANWLRLDYVARGTIPKVKHAWTPTPCMQCDNAPCIKAATGGAVYKRNDGIVIIDPVKAVGQKQIAESCPYGQIYWNSALNLPQKCTFCAHFLDNTSLDGGSQTPRCVIACATDAISFGKDTDLMPFIKANNAQPLHPEYGTQSRVYYIGIPTRFVAGTVFDSKIDEDVMGATVTLTDTASGQALTTTTDRFGDFWFENLAISKLYNVTINASGYNTKTLMAFTDTDQNLGSIDLK